MKREGGYTFIELILFIVITLIIFGGIFSAFNVVVYNTPKVQNQSVATQLASKCLEWYLGERYMQGYDHINCPSNDVPAFCSVSGGYTVTTDVGWTTLYGDSGPNYKTITVSVSGRGEAALSLIIADY